MSLASLAYRAIFKKTSSILVAASLVAVVYERTVDVVGESIFYWYNRGLLWDDIKDNYKK